MSRTCVIIAHKLMTPKRHASLKTLTTPKLLERRNRLANRVPDLEATLHGALLTQRRRCGNPGCRCARGELHGPYVYLSARVGRRTRLLYIPAALATAVRDRVRLTTQLEETLAAISAINLELLARGALD
jgi:uncharacterized protein DUF6788